MREDDKGPRGPERIDDLQDREGRLAELRRREGEPIIPEPPEFVGGPGEIETHWIDHLPADVELGDATDPNVVSGDVTPQVEEDDG